MIDNMPATILAKNYSHCPFKKRPVQLYLDEIPDEPENLSTKPEDLSRTGVKASPSSPVSSIDNKSAGSPFSIETSPPSSPPMSSPSPPRFFQPIVKGETVLPYHPAISEYAPHTWHRSVAPVYPTNYPFNPYGYHHDYYRSTSPYSDSSLSPSYHQVQQPIAPIAIKPTLPQLSPSSSISPPLNTSPEDLSDKRKQGIRHQCSDCGKSYSTFSGLSKHRQFHCAVSDGPKKSFSCKYCEKVYVSLGALKMHIRTHTLPCKCTICGKAFSRPWLLQGHVRTHTGEKPFSCTFCNRAFADRSNLRAHLQTHSDVKKYSCHKCSKTFSRMSLLTKHAETCCLINTSLSSQPLQELKRDNIQDSWNKNVPHQIPMDIKQENMY